MSTIILISIGILLAAASTLMAVHYGGDAMNSGSVKASAATLENAAQNVLVALTGRGFRGDRSTPYQIGQLDGGGNGGSWLGSMPDVSTVGGGEPAIMEVEGKRVYGVPGIPVEVCAQVNRDYHGVSAAIPDGLTGGRRGCMSRPDGSHLFYVVLGQSS